MDPSELDPIVSSLLKSYDEIGGINHLDCKNLPSKLAIGELCENLLRLLFPGFFDHEAIETEQLSLKTAELVRPIYQRLVEEIRYSFQWNDKESDYSCQAHEIVCQFLHQLPQVRTDLRTDVQAAYEGDPAAVSYEEIILAYPGLEAVAIQRAAHILYNQKVPLVPRMMTEWAHSRTGIDIHPGAQIGQYFFIDHGTGVVVGETCVIGSHVKLYHGVTLGAKSFQKDESGNIVKGIKRHPRVEDHVTIYPNTSILGGDTVIGARSTIGANVFLMKSVPADTLLVRGQQTQTSHDKRSKKSEASAHVKVSSVADDIEFYI